MLYFKSILTSEHNTPQNHGKFRKNIYMKFNFTVKFLLQNMLIQVIFQHIDSLFL